MTTEDQAIQDVAQQEIREAYHRLHLMVCKLDHPTGSYRLKYDDVSDLAELLARTAWRLSP